MDPKQILGLLGALIAAIAVEFNDQVVTAALPDIKGGLGISNDPGTWITSLYASGQVIGMAISTSLAVGFSIRRFALFAFALCTLASLAVPFSNSLAALFIFRFLQGLGGGFIIPLLLTVGIRVLGPEIRLYGLAAYALTATFAPNISVSLAALWDDNLNWTFVFWESLPLFSLAAVLVWYGMPQDEPQYKRLNDFDWLGAGLVTIAGFSFVSLLEQGNRLDWFNSNLICILALLSALSIPALIANELRQKTPLFGLWLLKRRNFAFGFVGLFTFLIVSQSSSTLPISFLQQVAGFRPEQIYPISLEVAVLEVLMLPLLAVVLNQKWADPRVVASIGLGLIIAADIGDSYITGFWVSDSLVFWQGLQTIGQPMFIMSLLLMSTNTIRDPKDGPFGAAMINTTRAVAEPVGVWLTELIMRWRGALHYNRIADQMGQTRYRVIQAQGLLPGSPAPLLPNGQPRAPGALAALRGAVQAQATVMTLADAFLIFALLTGALLVVLWLVAERTWPPRIALAKA